jgi:hypothetical protein
MAENVRERLAVGKQRTYRFHVERFSLKNLNETECIDEYRDEVSSRFAALILIKTRRLLERI